MNFGTWIWNVYSIKGKLNFITKDLGNLKIYNKAETRKKETSSENSRLYLYCTYTSVQWLKEQRARRGN